jgi:hypothetical protein
VQEGLGEQLVLRELILQPLVLLGHLVILALKLLHPVHELGDDAKCPVLEETQRRQRVHEGSHVWRVWLPWATAVRVLERDVTKPEAAK